MSFSSSDRSNPALSSIYKSVLSQFEGDLATRLNVEQMFLLIDGLLPFEACLYHQVLPLFVEGSRFNLGMVAPTDVAATDYVRRMISYVNYSLVVQEISSTALQTALSAYLNYVSVKRSQAPSALPESTHSHPEPEPESTASWSSTSKKVVDLSERQTFILDDSALRLEQEKIAALEQSLQPEASDDLVAEALSADLNEELSADLNTDAAEVLHIAEPESDLNLAKAAWDSAPSDQSSTLRTKPNARKRAAPPLPSWSTEPIPVLRLQANHRQDAIEQLKDRLNPSLLLQELLARVLETGIGRLYFERQKHRGRVLWSESGVLKAVLDQLKPDYCQSLVDELKLLMQIPLLPTETAQQTEVERIYENERILIRCRFMGGVHGEEATLQVLRGAALRFYEQQQVDRLGNDALVLARELHSKLTEIRSRVHTEPRSAKGSLNKLNDLQQALDNISTQIQDLQSIQGYELEP